MTFSLTGNSLLHDSPVRFLSYLLLSVLFWFVFELYNVRLANWYCVYAFRPAWGRLRHSASCVLLSHESTFYAEMLAAQGVDTPGEWQDVVARVLDDGRPLLLASAGSFPNHRYTAVGSIARHARSGLLQMRSAIADSRPEGGAASPRAAASRGWGCCGNRQEVLQLFGEVQVDLYRSGHDRLKDL